MRPGQLTPENMWPTISASTDLSCFNEAGAINPGKPFDGPVVPMGRVGASMRPGQLTPENCDDPNRSLVP